jgi:hypothetical protein
LTWKCPACGQINEDSNQFCSTCLVERPSSPSATTQENTPEQVSQPAEDLGQLPQTEAQSSPPESVCEPSTAEPPVTPAPGAAKKYFVLFVNSPASSLLGAKVPIEFDLFPVITIGRSPENVLAIPDHDVSRKHAELTLEANDLRLKDLNSTNGTYVFDGKSFQQITGDTVIKPNTIVKFGSNTIVRIVSE